MNTTTETLSPRVSHVRSQIAAGTYKTPERIDGTADRLLDVLGDISLSDTEQNILNPVLGYGGCRGASDGECIWNKCPQLRDGEPEKSGRHCPLDKYNDEDECSAILPCPLLVRDSLDQFPRCQFCHSRMNRSRCTRCAMRRNEEAERDGDLSRDDRFEME